MVDDKDFSKQISGRKLTDVFKELEEARKNYENANLAEQKRQFNSSSENIGKIKKPFTYKKAISISSIVLFILILVAVLIISFSNSILAKNSLASSDVITYDNSDLDIEINRHRLNINNIITANAALEVVKEQVVEERDIPFEIIREEVSYLPKGEEKTIQEGEVGKKNVTCVKTYENGEFTSENILNEEKTKDYLPQIITVGTSEFLYKLQAHIGDTLYLKQDYSLTKEPNRKILRCKTFRITI